MSDDNWGYIAVGFAAFAFGAIISGSIVASVYESRAIFLVAVSFCASAHAEMATSPTAPKKEPSRSDISPVGSAITVENMKCWTTSVRTINCLNIGRFCVEWRAKEKKHTDYYFGCALEDWQRKHPGEECDFSERKSEDIHSECWEIQIQ